MGFIQAASGALGGALADQWKGFFTVPAGISPSAAFFPAVREDQSGGRGSTTARSQGIISNGSQIIVPEGYALLTFENGEITGLAAQAGAYTWSSDDLNSQSVFAGDGFAQVVTQSWERFKFGGRPGSQQQALFVSLKEIIGNRFGTQSEIYWDDAYLNAQAGALTRGAYTLKIVDPILFAKNFVPATYLQNGVVFDFSDVNNPAATQLFNEVIASLAQAFSLYTNDPAKARITKLQSDSVGFAHSLAQVVEQNYGWVANRGLEIVQTAIVAVEYDETTKVLLQKVQQADALSGARGNSNLQASLAAGLQSAGETGGGAGILGVGMAAGGFGGTGVQQSVPATAPNASAEDPFERLAKLKSALDQGLITQDDYDKAKAKALDL
ncbi:MAG TPA: SPFH domain-containing protein [Pseudolysinimonas sp.]|jgi:membrane protease subunit (stomatin/prohibitin family)